MADGLHYIRVTDGKGATKSVLAEGTASEARMTSKLNHVIADLRRMTAEMKREAFHNRKPRKSY